MLRNADYIYDNIIIADEINTTKKYCKKAQSGVDLSVKEIRKFISPGIVLKDKTLASQTVPIEKTSFKCEEKWYIGWLLKPGTYIVELNEGCSFGPNDAGYIILRSSLNRSGVSIFSALWDPGYTSKLGDSIINSMSVRMVVDTEQDFVLEENARIAQLIVLKAEDTELYNGQWQGGLKVSNLVKN